MPKDDVFCERLTALDAAFLSGEAGNAHMHIASLLRFAPGGMTREGGGVDFDALRDHALDMIETEPRLRQRLSWAPVLQHPYWVDDPSFNLDFHVRHVSLPRPGGDDHLKRLMGRVVSQRLDRERPLWELWIVEGLEGGGFALIVKFHHCVLDGMAAMGLMARLVKGQPGSRSLRPPRPPPTGMQLLDAELRHRGRSVQALGKEALERDDARAEDRSKKLASGFRTFTDLLRNRSPRTRFNPAHLGEQRRFEMFSLSLNSVRTLRRRHGGTVNDVLLAVVTGGLRRYLQRTGVDPASQAPFRALVPVSTAGKHAKKKLGNAVAMTILDLPIDEPDPVTQLRRVREASAQFRGRGHEIDSTRWVSDLDDRLGLGLLGSAFRWGGRLRPYNVLVTSVPASPVAVDIFGARLQAMYGAAPLLDQQALSVAVFAYARQLHFGLQADFDTISDLDHLVADLLSAHDALCASEAPAQTATADG